MSSEEIIIMRMFLDERIPKKDILGKLLFLLYCFLINIAYVNILQRKYQTESY